MEKATNSITLAGCDVIIICPEAATKPATADTHPHHFLLPDVKSFPYISGRDAELGRKRSQRTHTTLNVVLVVLPLAQLSIRHQKVIILKMPSVLSLSRSLQTVANDRISLVVGLSIYEKIQANP